jgi:hypothetical protein
MFVFSKKNLPLQPILLINTVNTRLYANNTTISKKRKKEAGIQK